ncbi:MAG: MFS transporter [Clostridiales bacterium]|jgi:Na+/melibiose symporter-like transporter|nr:MFS transporter [Clostridiales bacterium]
MKTASASKTPSPDKIPLYEKLVYGAADLFGGGHNTILSVILLYFFTDILGINPALAGTIILVSKFWDAIIDPVLGSVSDNTRSKFGRRKPYILTGAILIIPAYALLFAPISNVSPDSLKAGFAAASYIFYCTAASLSQVPFMSMSGDISPDFKERNSANLVKLVFDMAAAAVCYLAPTALVDLLNDGAISVQTFYFSIVFGFGLVFSIPLAVSAFVLKERVPAPKARSKFDVKEWFAAFRVKSYRYHIFMYITAFLCIDIVSALALYYVNDVLRGVTVFGRQIGSIYVIAPMMTAAAAAVPFCYRLMKKKSKQFAYRVGLPLYALGAVLLALFDVSAMNGIFVPLFALIAGLGLGGAQMMPWLIFPDTVDVAELKLGCRPTGAFSGAMTFARTLVSAVAIQAVGLVLFAAGYKESPAKAVVQEPSVLLAIRLLLGISVVVLLSLAFAASMKYKVTDKKLARVRLFNEKNRGGISLTAEEQAEKEALLKELA